MRDTGMGLVDRMLASVEVASTGVAADRDEVVRVAAWLDSPTYAFFQRLHVNLEISITPGFHVYGEPIPRGFVPLSVQTASLEGVEAGVAEWSAPTLFTMEGLPEQFWVHTGTVRGSLPLTFSGPPGAGDHLIQVTVNYQACSDSACYAPASMSFSLPVREVALDGRELPSGIR